MEEEKTNKKCFRCGNFRCYYTKGLYRFSKTSQGYCLEKKEIVENTVLVRIGTAITKNFIPARNRQ